MPVPWAQIVQLMPSILEVSRELLKRARRTPPESDALHRPAANNGFKALETRVTSLEENERRQAELVNSMANQLEQLTAAVTALHARMRLLAWVHIVIATISLAALGLALHG